MDGAFDRGTNVVPFPSGRGVRPLMERVCELEPDMREVLFAADSLGLAMPAANLRDRADEETARHIAEQVLPLAPSECRQALDVLLASVAAVALRACADAAWASGHCAAALRGVQQARHEGGHWLDPLEERAETLALEAGRLLVWAHGVARAVGLARRGEAWAPPGGWPAAERLTESGRALGGP